MRFQLDIDYPVERMEQNRRRMEARARFAYVDRVPVGFCLVPRYFAPVLGVPYNVLFRSVEEHYHWQLQFLKYRLENIPEDMVCTGPTLCVGPYFDNVLDSAAFREFCVPYTGRLFDTFGGGLRFGRGLHMCGQSTHLHSVLVDDLRISSFDLFGYLVEPQVAARNLGGRMLLWGNLNPMLMLNGTRQQVKHAARAALEAMAPCGGLLLGDGANVCPGTPIENLAVLTEAAEEYGLPPTAPRGAGV